MSVLTPPSPVATTTASQPVVTGRPPGRRRRHHPAAAWRVAAVAVSILALYLTMAGIVGADGAAADTSAAQERLWWYVARAGGLTAWWLLCIAVLWGLLLSTRLLGERPTPGWLLDLHRMLGGLAVAFTAVHALGLYLDEWSGIGLTELAVPLAAQYQPTAVALGVVGLYLLLAIEVTSLLRRRISPVLWRWVHRAAFVVFVLATVHMFAAGTDGGNRWLRSAAILACYGFAVFAVVRLGGFRRTPRRRPPRRQMAVTNAAPPTRAQASVPSRPGSVFHPLTVQEIVRETADAVSVAFAVPRELVPAFRFDPGQHLTLRLRPDGEEVRRSYSLCSGITDGELRIAVKRVDGGRASPWVNRRLAVGDTVEVAAPAGRFRAAINPLHERHLFGIAAGSGITPVLSILKSVLAAEPRSRFTLVYGNRDAPSTIFRDELARLQREHGERLRVVHVLSRCERTPPPLRGRIGADKLTELEHLLDLDTVDEAYLCGPSEMTLDVREALVRRGLPRERVHVELFGSPARPATHPRSGASGVTYGVAVVDRGARAEIEVRGGETVLDAALRSGLDLPYSCREGVCGTCRARVACGQVRQDAAELTRAEVAAGYVLTCQARPQHDGVVISLDDG